MPIDPRDYAHRRRASLDASPSKAAANAERRANPPPPPPAPRAKRSLAALPMSAIIRDERISDIDDGSDDGGGTNDDVVTNSDDGSAESSDGGSVNDGDYVAGSDLGHDSGSDRDHDSDGDLAGGHDGLERSNDDCWTDTSNSNNDNVVNAAATTGSRRRGRGWTRSVLSWLGVKSADPSRCAPKGRGSARKGASSSSFTGSFPDSEAATAADVALDVTGTTDDTTGDTNLDAGMELIDEDSDTVVCRLRSTMVDEVEVEVGRDRGGGRDEEYGEGRGSLTGVNMQRFLASNGLGEYDLEGQGIESVEDLHALPHVERKRGSYEYVITLTISQPTTLLPTNLIHFDHKSLTK